MYWNQVLESGIGITGLWAIPVQESGMVATPKRCGAKVRDFAQKFLGGSGCTVPGRSHPVVPDHYWTVDLYTFGHFNG